VAATGLEGKGVKRYSAKQRQLAVEMDVEARRLALVLVAAGAVLSPSENPLDLIEQLEGGLALRMHDAQQQVRTTALRLADEYGADPMGVAIGLAMMAAAYMSGPQQAPAPIAEGDA
jgi:hypothetical protein